ncbi:ArsR/SmtB family transcription factor [Streptomyces uncialis]|uniref:ArsR/SmtB family transcription factor n=1 Tax=Streptomyces uncialis TaxID=1048205 RepID=UPI0033C79674
MALAHPVRIRLCWEPARVPCTTGEPAKGFGMTAPEVSRHLKALREAGTLTTRHHGRYVQNQLDTAPPFAGGARHGPGLPRPMLPARRGRGQEVPLSGTGNRDALPSGA